MSLRAKIMHCVARDIVVLDDIIAEIDDTPDRIRGNLHAARHEDLLSHYLDDDTQRPAYKLTERGRAWLKKQKAPAVPVNGGSEPEHEASETDAQQDGAKLKHSLVAEMAEDLREAQIRIYSLQSELNKERADRIRLEEQVKSLSSTTDSRESAMYLVRTPKAEPRLVFRLDRAVEKAKSCARKNGRADVFALLPVGRAVVGAEWRETK